MVVKVTLNLVARPLILTIVITQIIYESTILSGVLTKFSER